MSPNLIVAVTDDDWFRLLRQQRGLEDVNFWAPNSGSTFRALKPGELLLFKLRAPIDRIVGGGVFVHANTMPCSLAWRAFGIGNGARTEAEMRQRIMKYRKLKQDDRADFSIGCRILSEPFFLEEREWISVPASWSRNIVQFKSYSTGEPEGRELWDRLVMARAATLAEAPERVAEVTGTTGDERWGSPQILRPRLGQGAFRIRVTDNYQRRCAVTRERTLPALEAAHIRPYADGGEHADSNGLLLRSDVHQLFDAGYVTVTPEYRFEVSPRIREEFENGRHYYELHGREIQLPARALALPDKAALAWHNEHRYRG